MENVLYSTISQKRYDFKNFNSANGTQFLCETAQNDYLHTLYYPLGKKEGKALEKIMKALKKDGEKLSEYVNFLSEHNGAILYGGSVVLFGFAERSMSLDEPVSLIEENERDGVSKRLNRVIYIGNAPYIKGGNVNFYFNVISGCVTAFYDNQIIYTWFSIKEFCEHILRFYDDKYLTNGRNKYYNEKEHGVWHNIQLWDLEEA